jgi:hypothetical protein
VRLEILTTFQPLLARKLLEIPELIVEMAQLGDDVVDKRRTNRLRGEILADRLPGAFDL